MRRELLPLDELPSWLKLANIELNGITVLSLSDGKGCGIVATRESSENDTVLMTVPNNLILSLDSVWTHAESDHHLHEVLQAMGDFAHTPRGAILIFLILQITASSPDIPVKIGVSSPWSEYVKFLRPDTHIPTFWDNTERELLIGTTLESAVKSKLMRLSEEFARLRNSTKSIGWCRHWWDDGVGKLTVDDWKLVDALYRSRAMDLPNIGQAFVPVIDMANHASGDDTMAHYDADIDGNVVLLLRNDKTYQAGDEVTIDYGDSKGASEWLFSYGFIDDNMTHGRSLFLDLDIPDDDPLKWCKKTALDAPPGFRLFVDYQRVQWEGPYVWLQCVNEEDGLRFHEVQANNGEKELKVSWHGEEFEGIVKLQNFITGDDMHQLFCLRALTVMQERIQKQLLKRGDAWDSIINGRVASEFDHNSQNYINAQRLGFLEVKLLQKACVEFDSRTFDLFNTDAVQRYLSPESFAMPNDDCVSEVPPWNYDDDA